MYDRLDIIPISKAPKEQISKYGSGPWRIFSFRGEVTQDTACSLRSAISCAKARGGSKTMDIELAFENRQTAIRFAEALVRAAEAARPTRRLKP